MTRTRAHFVAAALVVALSGVSTSALQSVRDVLSRLTTANGTAVVEGQVLVAETGAAPARNARVTLNTAAPGIPGRTTTTDDEGRFRFTGVPAARYALAVTKPGYLTAERGAVRPGGQGTDLPVGDGAQVTGLTIWLHKGGVITGTVRDEVGQPVRGASIDVLRFSYSPTGERMLTPESAGGSGTTDDRGVYRAWGLPRGMYVVGVAPLLSRGRSTLPTDFRVLTTEDVDRMLALTRAGDRSAASRGAPGGNATGSNARRVNYAPVFHPGVADLDEATTVRVVEGEERDGVDVTVRRWPTSTVSGRVRSPNGALPASLSVAIEPTGAQADLLASSGPGLARSRSVRIDDSGQFTIFDVTPGTYDVLARPAGGVGRGRRGSPASPPPETSAVFALTEVRVDGADVEVDLVLEPTMSLRGRIAFDGATAPPANLSLLQIMLIPPGAGGNLRAGLVGGRVGQDGTFELAGILPDTYRMAPIFTMGLDFVGWTLRSAEVGGQDVLGPGVTVHAGDTPEMVVTFTDRPTAITGRLQDASGRAAPDYFVIAFPEDPAAWIPGTFHVRSTRPGADGEFSIEGLAPGRYLIAALTDLEPFQWFDPALLEEAAAAAVPIVLGDGQRVRQDFQIR